jgi:hypothetical protein
MEEYRLRVSENRMLRGLFGPKMAEVRGGWRKMYNYVLHNSYSSLNIIMIVKSMRMKLEAYVEHTGKKRDAYKISTKKLIGKRPLRTTRSRWMDNIKMEHNG